MNNKAVYLAALWAQQLGLPRGNLWESALARQMEREAARLGGDRVAWAFVEALYRVRLGLVIL